MKELNHILGIKTKLSTAFHPQTDSQTERMNQELEQYLWMFIDHQQEQWPEWLGMAEFAYNNKVHTGTKVSPFKANNRQDPRIGFEMRKKGKYKGAEKFAEMMKSVQEEAKAVLQKVRGKDKYFVRWKGCTAEEDIWKSKENLKNAIELVKEFEKEYRREKEEEVRQQEGEENRKMFSREILGRYTAKLLYRWANKKYNREY